LAPLPEVKIVVHDYLERSEDMEHGGNVGGVIMHNMLVDDECDEGLHD
jgi:hypothetical protein